jgi:hypothetical protein
VPRGISYKKRKHDRDRKLVERYYYWTEVKRRRFDDAWKILSEQEFFLSEQRVIQIVRENQKYVDELRGQGMEMNQLKLF